VVSFTPLPLYLRRKGTRYPLNKRLAEPHSRSGLYEGMEKKKCEENVSEILYKFPRQHAHSFFYCILEHVRIAVGLVFFSPSVRSLRWWRLFLHDLVQKWPKSQRFTLNAFLEEWGFISSSFNDGEDDLANFWVVLQDLSGAGWEHQRKPMWQKSQCDSPSKHADILTSIPQWSAREWGRSIARWARSTHIVDHLTTIFVRFSSNSRESL
jgi:hypothetical protein